MPLPALARCSLLRPGHGRVLRRACEPLTPSPARRQGQERGGGARLQGRPPCGRRSVFLCAHAGAGGLCPPLLGCIAEAGPPSQMPERLGEYYGREDHSVMGVLQASQAAKQAIAAFRKAGCPELSWLSGQVCPAFVRAALFSCSCRQRTCICSLSQPLYIFSQDLVEGGDYTRVLVLARAFQCHPAHPRAERLGRAAQRGKLL